MDADRLREQYEQLRGSVVARPRRPGAAFGEAIVRRQGLAAWMESSAALPAEASELQVGGEPRAAAPLPIPLHSELLNVLTGLVLASHVSRGRSA